MLKWLLLVGMLGCGRQECSSKVTELQIIRIDEYVGLSYYKVLAVDDSGYLYEIQATQPHTGQKLSARVCYKQ